MQIQEFCNTISRHPGASESLLVFSRAIPRRLFRDILRRRVALALPVYLSGVHQLPQIFFAIVRRFRSALAKPVAHFQWFDLATLPQSFTSLPHFSSHGRTKPIIDGLLFLVTQKCFVGYSTLFILETSGTNFFDQLRHVIPH